MQVVITIFGGLFPHFEVIVGIWLENLKCWRGAAHILRDSFSLPSHTTKPSEQPATLHLCLTHSDPDEKTCSIALLQRLSMSGRLLLVPIGTVISALKNNRSL